jgi:hypothetical protein
MLTLGCLMRAMFPEIYPKDAININTCTLARVLCPVTFCSVLSKAKAERDVIDV